MHANKPENHHYWDLYISVSRPYGTCMSRTASKTYPSELEGLAVGLGRGSWLGDREVKLSVEDAQHPMQLRIQRTEHQTAQ